jgi:HEAT repeat protein
MGFLDSLFGGTKPPSTKQVDSTVLVLQRRHGEPAFRYEAADKLLGWGTPEAVEGLLQRFTVTVALETSDDEEKAYIVDKIVETIGSDAIPAIEKYLRREEQVNWPLRLLQRLVQPDEFKGKVLRILASLDVHFDKNPGRKVELIHALVEFSADPEVADTVAAFLDDTDDTVRIAAAQLLTQSGREKDFGALVDSLLASPDRPRVKNALLQALLDKPAALKGRRAEVEPLLDAGLFMTNEGTLRRLGQ